MAMQEVLGPFALFARPAAVEMAGGDESKIAAVVAQYGTQSLGLGAFIFAREVWDELSDTSDSEQEEK